MQTFAVLHHGTCQAERFAAAIIHIQDLAEDFLFTVTKQQKDFAPGKYRAACIPAAEHDDCCSALSSSGT